MSGELSKLNVQFKILNTSPPSGSSSDSAKSFRWKDLQDLGHSPVDFSTPQSGESKITSEGYAGPEYKNPFRTGIGTPVSDIKLGLCLDINQSPGAPANSFVWGCEPEGHKYLNNERNLIVCKMGPSVEFFTKVRSFTEEELLGTVGVNSERYWLSGVTGGRAESAVYIPEHIGALPGNLKTAEVLNLVKSGTYDTNNIWNIQDLANDRTGSATGRYVEGQGTYSPNSLLGRAYLIQSDGGRVGFFAANSKARIFQVGSGGNSVGDAKPINLKGKWFITADWGNYQYLYGPGAGTYLPELGSGGPGDDVSYLAYFRPAALTIGNGQKYVDGGENPSVSPGFTMNLKFKAKQSLDIFRGGHPGVDIFIGNRSAINKMITPGTTISSDNSPISDEQVKWARVSLSANRPPIIMFPTLYTSGARYIRIGGDSVNGAKSKQYNVMQIIAGKKAIKADSSDAEINIKYELLGDVGHIDVAPGGEATPINAVIAPQREVITGRGYTTESNEAQSCWCAIDGFADLTVTNCNGSFSFSPLCYMSWSPDALMFNHHKFNMYWSDFVNDNFNDKDGGIYAEPHETYQLKDIAVGDTNPMPQTNFSRYPDIILDRRLPPNGNSIISFMHMNVDLIKRITDDSEPDDPTTIWKDLYSPSRNEFIAYDMNTAFVKDHSKGAISSRGVYGLPSYGKNLIDFANYQIPSVAVWSHLYANAILTTAWPKTDHNGWIDTMRKTIPQANIFGDSIKSQQVKTPKNIEHNATNIVSSFQLRSSYEAPIIKRVLNITIINPDIGIMGNIFNRADVVQGNKLHINFEASAPTTPGNTNGNQTSFSGVLINLQEKIIGAGIEINMEFQDKFSYAMEQLIYPSYHRIDGWPFYTAIEYLLLRTGLNTDDSMHIVKDKKDDAYGLGDKTKALEVLIGRYVVSDQKANSISYEPRSLMDNLSKALGPLLLMGQYPVFYSVKDGERDIIKYDNMLGGKRLFNANTSWSRFVGEDPDTEKPNKTIVDFSNIGTDINYIPYARSSFSLSVQNSQTYNQILFSSHDRYRNTPIISSAAGPAASQKAAVKNMQVHNFDNVITSQTELADLTKRLDKQHPEATPMKVNFSVLGMPLKDINDNGGCGYIEYKNVPFANDLLSRYWMLRETTISWDANQGNQVKTDVVYEVLRPAVMSMSNPLTGG